MPLSSTALSLFAALAQSFDRVERFARRVKQRHKQHVRIAECPRK